MGPWVDLVIQTFGALGVIVAGVIVILKLLWPRYEARTQQVIAGYEARLAEYGVRLEEYKEQLEKATQERREITEKFLAALNSQVASSDTIQRQLVDELRSIRQDLVEVKKHVRVVREAARLRVQE